MEVNLDYFDVTNPTELVEAVGVAKEQWAILQLIFVDIDGVEVAPARDMNVSYTDLMVS